MSKQIAVRIDARTAAKLKARAAIEGRSMNSIVVDAIEEYTIAHPVARTKISEMVRKIAQDDASLLQALAEL